MSYSFGSTASITYGNQTGFDGAAQVSVSFWIRPATTSADPNTWYLKRLYTDPGTGMKSGWAIGTAYANPTVPGADEALIAFIDRPTCRLHFLLTKADQLNNSEKRLAIDRAQRRAEELGPRASAQLFSALKRQGVEELETTLAGWLRD